MQNLTIEECSQSKTDKKPFNKAWSYIKGNWPLFAMLAPGFLVLLVFAYFPMVGISLAFKNYNPSYGIFASPWNEDLLASFKYVFTGYGFFKLVRNTLLLGVMNLVFAFPSSIILALMFNEIQNKAFKKTTQTISYLPYFISWIVIATISYSFLSMDYGLINKQLQKIGIEPIFWYAEPKYWPWILTFVGIWKSIGWGTITFLSGITGIDPSLYEAAIVDGAGRWKQTIYVTIPGIMPIIGITFILTVANIVKDDFEKIYALVGNNTLLLESTDVLGTWVYRTMNASFKNYGEVTAVTLMQGIISLIIMIGANKLVKKTGNMSLW
jgi:putative aldouronate transport system permease protein